METDYSKHTYFQWKVKWRLEHLGALGTMGETAPLTNNLLTLEHGRTFHVNLVQPDLTAIESLKEGTPRADAGYHLIQKITFFLFSVGHHPGLHYNLQCIMLSKY